jgi:hypothetical protein
VELKQFVQGIFDRLAAELEMAVTGLTPEDLNHQPMPDSNSIGWLIWHTTRSRDRMDADLFGEDQLWVSGQWHVKFNRSHDQKDTGFGHTQARVAAFRAPGAQTLLDYARAIYERNKVYITTRLTEADLQREVKSLTLGTTATVEERILTTINDFQHIGQAGYVRGMLKGKGWYGR